jgi:CheY-like chemotaxis protein
LRRPWTCRPIPNDPGEAEQPLRRGVEGFDAATSVDDDDAVHGGIHDGPPPRFAGSELPLEANAPGQVVQDAGELALAADPHLAHGELHREQRTVPSPPAHFTADADDPRLAGRQVARDVLVVLLAVRRGHQHADVAAEDLGFGVAEEPLGSRIERLDPARGINDDDAVGGHLEDGLEAFGLRSRESRRLTGGVSGQAQAIGEPGNCQNAGDEEGLGDAGHREPAGLGTIRTCRVQANCEDEAALRILVVEDEALIRWAVTQALTAAGHTVLEAPDAATALRLIAEASEPMDAVLLDLRLPDSSDLSLLAAIRRRTPTSAVVMMTAHGTPDDAVRARALGAFDVVEKPFDVQQIEQLVVAAWRARR